METYFKKKIGEKINTSFTTGNDFYTEVYKRTYNVEVLKVEKGVMHVDVNSYDVTPSGLMDGDSRKSWGESTVKIGSKSKTEVIDEVVRKVDKLFFKKYKL